MIKMLSVLLVLMPFGCASGPHVLQGSAHTEPVAHATAATISNDPQTLIHSCGRPDNSNDSVFIQPAGGGITSRSLTYNKAHLKVTYISSGQGTPEQWDFSSLVDTETNRALDTGDLQNILQKRLPCAVHANGEIAQNAEAPAQKVTRAARQRVSKSGPDS